MNRQKTCLWTGFAGALLGITGELLGGMSPSTDFTNRITILFSAMEQLPVWRLGLCSTVGALGILLQFFGYYGILLSFEDRENLRGRLYFCADFGFCIIGAIYHILCCIFIYLYRILLTVPDQMWILDEFFLFFCLPLTVLFFVSYLTACLLFSLQIGGGHSSFPRWCGIFNPLLLNLTISGIISLLPVSAITNGIGFASIGFSSLILFSVLLIADRH